MSNGVDLKQNNFENPNSPKPQNQKPGFFAIPQKTLARFTIILVFLTIKTRIPLHPIGQDFSMSNPKTQDLPPEIMKIGTFLLLFLAKSALNHVFFGQNWTKSQKCRPGSHQSWVICRWITTILGRILRVLVFMALNHNYPGMNY